MEKHTIVEEAKEPVDGHLLKLSAQDRLERILKKIHVMLAEGEPVPGKSGKICVDRDAVCAMLERLNVAVKDLVEESEMSRQARDLAVRRSERQGEEMVSQAEKRADDIYAASLLYTDDALAEVQRKLDDALRTGRKIWMSFSDRMEEEQKRIRDDQMTLREQLQDLKDSEEYLGIVEERRAKREKLEKEKQETNQEKKIQNEAKHYPAATQPEIRVNKAYFERRRKLEEEAKAEKETPGPEADGPLHVTNEEQEPVTVQTPPPAKVIVNENAAYFRRKEAEQEADRTESEGQAETEGQTATEGQTGTESRKEAENKKETESRKEWHFPFGRK